jgi:toxin ParE1/3/4
VTVASNARRDLDTYTLWLRSEVDAETAVRFAEAAILTFEKLAQTPNLGPRVISDNADLATIRKWRVDGFPKVLLFYRPTGTGIRVIRVLHAAQDWWSHLDQT